MWTWHPDNLIVGKEYKVRYMTHEREVDEFIGTFRRMRIEYGVLWTSWGVDGVSMPYEIKEILDVEEL